MYAGQIDGTGNDLYPEIQVLDGETVLLLFHKDSSKLQIRECSCHDFFTQFTDKLHNHTKLVLIGIDANLRTRYFKLD